MKIFTTSFYQMNVKKNQMQSKKIQKLSVTCKKCQNDMYKLEGTDFTWACPIDGLFIDIRNE